MPSSTALSTLSLHDALPICFMRGVRLRREDVLAPRVVEPLHQRRIAAEALGAGDVLNPVVLPQAVVGAEGPEARFGADPGAGQDRKSTRLNSSHSSISYAVFHRALHSFPTRRSSDLLHARR